MKYDRHKQKNNNKQHRMKDEYPLQNSTSQPIKEIIQVRDMATDGRGVARLSDGSIVFIPKLLTKESALVQVVNQKSSYKCAELLHLEQSSPERILPVCKYTDHCGGCQLQHQNPIGQIEFKLKCFFETLRRVGKWDDRFIQKTREILQVVYLNTLHYRRRVRLHFDGNHFGFKEKNSYKITDISFCLTASTLINHKIIYLKNKLIQFSQDLKSKNWAKKIQCEIEFTESDDGRVILLIVDFLSDISEYQKQCLEALKKVLDIQNDQLITLNHPFLSKFRIKKQSFVQPHLNSITAYSKKIYEYIYAHFNTLKQTARARHTLIAWDLYAGAGAFTGIPFWVAQQLSLTIQCIGVEGIVDAIDSFSSNYKSIPQVTGIVKDVFDFIDENFAQNLKNNIDIILLDPPRSGIGIAAMQKLVELSALNGAILYLACDPASFARDTRILFEAGYKLKNVAFFESFAYTVYYEVLGFFVRGY